MIIEGAKPEPPLYDAPSTSQPFAGSTLTTHTSAAANTNDLPNGGITTLAWEGDVAQPPSSQRSYTEDRNPPTVEPPGYQAARNPTETIVYTFSQFALNEMLLLPSAYAADSRPAYHISVGFNCFKGTSLITTVKRGSNMGEEVGAFEMGISHVLGMGTVSIRNREYTLKDIWVPRGMKDFPAFEWLLNHRLIWKFVSPTSWICTRPAPRTTLATYTSSPPLPAGKNRAPVGMPSLTVFPQGQDVFDDILLTVLIMERKLAQIISF